MALAAKPKATWSVLATQLQRDPLVPPVAVQPSLPIGGKSHGGCIGGYGDTTHGDTWWVCRGPLVSLLPASNDLQRNPLFWVFFHWVV